MLSLHKKSRWTVKLVNTDISIIIIYKYKAYNLKTRHFSERSTNSSGSYFVGHAVYDDFTTDYDVGRENVGAEFSQYELDSYSKPEERTQFDSKVEEDIYRAKKFLLKKNGHWD